MLTIKNMQITKDLTKILYDVRDLTHEDYLKDIKRHGEHVMVTCPFHNSGGERHPSCGVIVDKDSDQEGVFHCFTCGEKGGFHKLIGKCLGLPYNVAKDWLVEEYGDTFLDKQLYIPEIDVSKPKKDIVDEGILDTFDYNNEKAINYLCNKRHLKKNVVDFFKLGYDQNTDSVTFPIYDEKGDLVGISERKIEEKRFNLPKIKDKPCYLLNTAINNNYDHVYVVESQINALTLYGYGIPAIALFGTGTQHQYDVLKKSGVRRFTLVFDGDQAGVNGRDRFIKSLGKNCLIDYINMPSGKDVNDLTREEFMQLKANIV